MIHLIGFKFAAVVDTFIRAIEMSEFELPLQEVEGRLKAQDGARVAAAGSTWPYNRRV